MLWETGVKYKVAEVKLGEIWKRLGEETGVESVQVVEPLELRHLSLDNKVGLC